MCNTKFIFKNNSKSGCSHRHEFLMGLREWFFRFNSDFFNICREKREKNFLFVNRLIFWQISLILFLARKGCSDETYMRVRGKLKKLRDDEIWHSFSHNKVIKELFLVYYRCIEQQKWKKIINSIAHIFSLESLASRRNVVLYEKVFSYSYTVHA